MADASDLVLALAGTRVLSLVPNIVGPVSASRLRDLGARVTKVESPRPRGTRHYIATSNASSSISKCRAIARCSTRFSPRRTFY
jgi:crotonobetainyl-CoA:carnitine CoA-transferase CaiB-like acyl-CoA transferase